MKHLKVLLIFLATAALNSCSGGEESVKVMISSSAYQLIPAQARSCYAVATEGDNPAPYDVSADYFKVPAVAFQRANVSKELVIALIRIKVTIPGSSTGVDCKIGGDDLAALHDNWWGHAGREAIIPVGAATFATTCPIYCGGVERRGPFMATGTMEIFGLERDPNDITAPENPVSSSTSITIQSQF